MTVLFVSPFFVKNYSQVCKFLYTFKFFVIVEEFVFNFSQQVCGNLRDAAVLAGGGPQGNFFEKTKQKQPFFYGLRECVCVCVLNFSSVSFLVWSVGGTQTGTWTYTVYA